MKLVKVAEASEISVGSMKHIEAEGREILIANVRGKFYAVGDRCGHMNVRLSAGTLSGSVVTCPLHFSRFDVKTGKMVLEPIIPPTPGESVMECLPEEFRRSFGAAARRQKRLMKQVKTHDLETFRVVIEEGTILVEM